MGKNKKIMRNFGRAAAAMLTAFAVISAPSVSPDITASATAQYDQLLEEYEALAEQYKEASERLEKEIDGLAGDIEDNEYAMGLIEQQIANYETEIENYGDLITATQQKISDKEYEIFTIGLAIDDKETEIKLTREEIARLEDENEANLKKFAKLIRALYMNDASDNLPILDGSDDWYDFFVYVDVVQNISSQNMDFMNALLDDIHACEDMIVKLNNDIAQLNADKDNLRDQKTALEKEMADLEAKKTEVQGISDERYNKLTEYAQYNKNLEWQIYSKRSEVDDYEAQIEETNKIIEQIIREKQAALAGGYDYSSDGFRWPLDIKYQYITTYFGYDAWRGGSHYGIDVGNAGIGGANIYAAQSGVVITAYNDSGWHGGYGNYVTIDHGGGLSTLYAHCYSTVVTEGQYVEKGDVIGYVGTTGWSTGNHLHFETRVNGVAQNPFGYSYEYV